MSDSDMVMAFESDSPHDEDVSPAQVENKFDYAQVFEALEHADAAPGLEVASNVFARCAKKHFRRGLESEIVGKRTVKLVMPEDLAVSHRLWVTSNQVVLSRNPRHLTSNALDLEVLVNSASECVLRVADDHDRIHLVGALSTKVLEIGTGLYSFSIKQKWFSNASPPKSLEEQIDG